MTVADVVAKYQELSKSYIDPYVVRNHAFTYDQLEKTDYYNYISDAPIGYKEHINFNDPSLEIHSPHHHYHHNKPAKKTTHKKHVKTVSPKKHHKTASPKKHHKTVSPKKHHKKTSPKKVKGPTKKI